VRQFIWRLVEVNDENNVQQSTASVDVDAELDGVLFADSSVGERSSALGVWQGLGQSSLEPGTGIPVDQAQTIATASTLEEINEGLDGEGETVVIDTGIFSVLNSDSREEAEQRIEKTRGNLPEKKAYIEELADRAGIDVEFRTAERYWNQDGFWGSIDYFLDSENYGFEDIIRIRKRTDVNGEMTARDLSGLLEDRYDVETGAIDGLADAYQEHLGRELKASQLYFLAELGMGAFLQETEGLDVKLGQRSEKRYDRDGEPDYIHMTQPASLNSTSENPLTVDPYIDEELRVYADDTREEVREKVNSASVDHVTTDSDHGEVMNGLVGLTAYAVEIGPEPLEIRGEEIGSADEVVEFAEENHPDRYSTEAVADYIHENLTV
jgi:hypothetical protein